MVTNKQFEAAQLLEGAINGSAVARTKFVEGISTSDLPVALTPTLNQIALNTFAEQPTIWREFASRQVLGGFGSQDFYTFQGWGDADVEPETAGDDFISGGLPTVPEYGEYARLRFEASEKSLKLKKGGVAVQFSWELLKNPANINLIQSAFGEFGRRSRVKEDIEATKQLVSTTNFSAANGNVATGDASQPLSVSALEAAFEQIGDQTDLAGNRVIVPGGWKLVVPRSLELTAQQILNITSTKIEETVGGVTTTTESAGNPVAGNISGVVVNPYLTTLGGSSTAWYLVPTPGSTPNPSVVNLFLAGYENPQIFVKRTTNSAPEEGDFIDDSYETKTRHIVTGEFIDPAGTLKSDGVA